MTIDAVRTYLKLTSRAALSPAPQPDAAITLEKAQHISASDYRRLYALVGERWLWHDRNAWSDAELHAWLASPDTHVYVLRAGVDVAGYFELKQEHEAMEIKYFGLAPGFMGRGIGKWLLTRACEEAFTLGAQHVTLNTCTLDAPQALPNYLARGFTIVREERYVVESG